MNKILTISIAAYNAANLLDKCLGSLCEESILDDLEVLVINDGSSDNTEQVASVYAEKHPGTFRVISKENGGWGSTVNTGMREATGKYFRLLDADDWYFTENLPEYIALLKEVETDLVLARYGLYSEKLQRVYAYKSIPVDDNKFGKVYRYFDWCFKYEILMHCLAVKTELLKKANFEILDHCFYTDVQFTLCTTIYAETFTYFDKPIYCYRIGMEGQSTSEKGYIKNKGNNLRIAEYFIERYKDEPLTDEQKRYLYHKINYCLSLEYYTVAILDKKDRSEHLRKIETFIKKNDIEFESISTEVKVHNSLGWKCTSAVHSAFKLMKKIGVVFNKDAVNK